MNQVKERRRLNKQKRDKDWQINWRKRNLQQTSEKWNTDVCLRFNFVYWKSFANDLSIIYQSLFLVILLIINQSFINLLSIDYQWFTNAIFMLLSLLIVCQSFANEAYPFYYIGHIAVVATNYSHLLYQCFTNHYQSDPVLYITSLPKITNKLPIHHYQS